MNDRLLYRVSDVAVYLSVGKSKVYELMRSGRLPSVTIDGCRRVRGVELRAWVDSLERIAS